MKLNSQPAAAGRDNRSLLALTGRVEQELVLQELSGLATRICDHQVVTDDVTRRQLSRVLASLACLMRAHPLDARGRCARCRRRQPCAARAVMASYATAWLGREAALAPAAHRHD